MPGIRLSTYRCAISILHIVSDAWAAIVAAMVIALCMTM